MHVRSFGQVIVVDEGEWNVNILYSQREREEGFLGYMYTLLFRIHEAGRRFYQLAAAKVIKRQSKSKACVRR